MNKLVLLALLLVIGLAIHEIPMRHKPKTALELKRFLQYLRRSPFLQKIEKILSQVFPGKSSTGLYSYPEVKILNYLNTQYYGASFVNTPPDGILGMAWPAISENNCPLIFDLLWKQRQVDGNSFSFYLTKVPGMNGSALVLGGINPKYAAGSFKYHTLKSKNYWLLDMADIVFNGTSYKPASANLIAIIDTGTSLLTGPQQLVNNMTKAFGTGNYKQVDCSKVSSLPILSFKFGNDTYSLKGQDYILKTSDGSRYTCVLGIIGYDTDQSLGATFILGDIFLRTYYTHFDVANGRVGFALSK